MRDIRFYKKKKKKDTLSLNILFFFEVKFMHVFVKYYLGVWENDFTDISWRIWSLIFQGTIK